MAMEDKISVIKNWLGTGAINLFGLPMSGKDTQGIRLAEALGARFLSSGLIIRAMEQETHQNLTGNGSLAPTNLFYEWVLPYFDRDELKETSLVLSSVGRLNGEENEVMKAADKAGHPIKAAVVLNVSEADVTNRWETAKALGHREQDPSMPADPAAAEILKKRQADKDKSVFKARIENFTTQTIPVLQHYRSLGLLVEVLADADRDTVFNNLIDALYSYVKNK